MGMLSQKLLSQKMVAQNGTKPVIKPDLHDRLELTRIHQSQQQLQQMRGAGFNKSASSPIMVTGCLTSSQSSVVSTGSIKQRRLHPAADTLTLTLQPPLEDTIGTRDGVSPLYMEPYDILDTCCHGTKSHVECSACQQEL